MVMEIVDDEKPTHVTDRGGVVELSIKAADGEIYTWYGTGSVEYVRTSQEDPATRKMRPVEFIQAHLALDPSIKQRALPIHAAPVQDEQDG
jgi:hypothetical protein